MAELDLKGFLGAARKRRPRCQRFGRGKALQTPPVEDRGHGKAVGEADLKLLAASNAQPSLWRWALQGPYRSFYLSCAQGEVAGCGAQHQGLRWLGGDPAHRRGEHRGTQPRHQFASIGPEIPLCHEVDADHFCCDMSSCGAKAGWGEKGHFFAAAGLAHAISPPQRSR